MKADNNLDFNGMKGGENYKGGNKYSGNKSGLTAKENYGMGPRKGNLDTERSEKGEGKSVTKDAARRAPDTAKGGKIDGGASVKKPANADKIRY